jgi:hypothetical protein
MSAVDRKNVLAQGGAVRGVCRRWGKWEHVDVYCSTFRLCFLLRPLFTALEVIPVL